MDVRGTLEGKENHLSWGKKRGYSWYSCRDCQKFNSDKCSSFDEVSVLTDFDFKKLFGSEPNKELLIDFLNQLLPERHHIQALSYSRKEQVGHTLLDRKAIFDLYCIGRGEDLS